ncbi:MULTISPECIES: BTAD domain-containing putative transcriptional regulator [Myxococcus]|uniref:AAA family ATPase n=1 Tax=Myxococcus llanfairpwllgwyngyllgogerychwyrndrobwllllantysiliogogogochensis TaxID=2590453 RepID=A0A540X2N9_9BACT|nr:MULTISPECIES: BTAD domain-containing putative transcriptional regulator [Myxococcus]NTX07643.1 AAA family ATPase [Myxococcus sp. CA040A]TQF15532.1 AAA family ATPase [Myxococcus llanfairpwllgwyngyllgogerychwyrndrobwllllantysiliogogogochensis]
MAGDDAVKTQVFHLELLGEARLRHDGAHLPLERRTAAVLAWLALEGPHPKYRLAGLLWAESSEVTARNNMRQLLRRLRLSTGAELVQGGDVLSLVEGITIDASQLQAHALAGRHARVLEQEGVLLAALEFDDCPEFQAWLESARERLDKLRRRAASAESEARERAGDLSGALVLAEKLLGMDPYSEEAWRRLMRLHYVSGDRMAALNAFERCRRLLREELDTQPLPQTVALAREIERGPTASHAPRALAAKLPLSVLRPPVLVGREREWARMEEAWAAGLTIFLSGEPGVGKTRLAHDFAASRGNHLILESRPGEMHVAYSTHVRLLRQILARRPDPKLEPWVRRELARLMPDLAGSEGLPSPMVDEADRSRFLEANCQVVYQLCAGLDAIVADDLQYMDAATAEFALLMLSRRHDTQPGGSFPHFVDTFRKGELSPVAVACIQQLVEAGLAIVIELEPLETDAVGSLLGSLELAGAEGLTDNVMRYTGGNPLFIMEALRHLLESGGLERGWPEHIHPSGRGRDLIQQRLERLSPQALQVARLAALAKTSFELELAVEVLEMTPLTLAAHVSELEAAHILRGERFTHDLLFEVVRETIPPSLIPLLHRRLASALEQRKAAPVVVAQHWLEGKEPERAAPYLVAAANAEASAFRHMEAALLYFRAATALEEAGAFEEAARVRARARGIPSA